MNNNNNTTGSRGRGGKSRPSRPKAVPRPQTQGPLSSGKSVPGYSRPADRNGGAHKQVSVAAAYASGQRSKAPQIHAAKDRVRIIHRELVASVTGSVAYAIASTFALNPGQAATFPWLASQAQGWERYRFNKLRFCYYTRTGSNIPGSVQIIPDYDAADAAPVSEQIASSYEDVEEDVPWKDIECTLRPSALHALGPTKFIRTGLLAANQDIKTYDAGNLFLATTDGTAVPWGKLWVEYDVELITPQLNPSGASQQAAQGLSSSAPTTASMLAAAVAVVNSTPFVTVAGDVLTFQQAGQFLVAYFVAATTATQASVPAAAAGGVVLYVQNGGSGTSDLAQIIQMTAIVGSTLTFANTLVAGTSAQLVVSQLPAGLGTL